MANDTWEHIRYEQPSDGVARIVLARAQAANAQDYQLLSELNQAFDRAARDDSVRVIILAADGNHFSSGHDLRAGTDMSEVDPIGTWCCFDAAGAEGYMATEAEMYVGLCWRWRNIPKPTIAQVQGKVIAGGLMLVWPMDLVVCSEEATFSDPVVAFGVNGHEYFTHPYEAGARLAKEMLFTGRAITAQEAYQHGMVNKVVPARRARVSHAGDGRAHRQAADDRTHARQAERQQLARRDGYVHGDPVGVRPAPRGSQSQFAALRFARRSSWSPGDS